MIKESIPGEEWSPLSKRLEDELSGGSEIQAENGEGFSLELIGETREECSEEQRRNVIQEISRMSTAEKLRLAVLANREARNLLIRDLNKRVSLEVLRNQKITESEVVQYAQKRDLPDEILLAIARDPKWRKNYSLQTALVSNPKTPLSASLHLLPRLQERDLKSLSRDNELSSVLRRKVQEILQNRRKS